MDHSPRVDDDEDDFVLVAPTSSSHHDRSPPQDRITSPAAKEDATGILADLLIPGKGPPLKDQAVIAKHGKIISVGPRHEVLLQYTGSNSIKWHSVPVLMPGMWECHAHFMGADPVKPINSENLAFTNPTVAGARCVRALKETLYAGFTSCVDLGGYAPELGKVVDEGTVLGPRLYGAGGALSQTAGHGDVFE